MEEIKEIPFLCRKLKELRENNNVTLEEMTRKISEIENGAKMNKSSLSRVESGQVKENYLKEYALKYCKAFGMSEEEIKQFLRGERIAVVDTSALLKNLQLIDELNEEYSKVVIPEVVAKEINRIKDKKKNTSARKAWEILRGISYGDRTILGEYSGEKNQGNNDYKIIAIAKEVSEKYHCNVEIITEDTDYSVYLKGNSVVSALHLKEYMASRQNRINMEKVYKADDLYADSYKNYRALNQEEANAFLPDGNTLLISAVRNRKISTEQKKEKIRWLLSCGADVNKREKGRRYFPPISHAIQMGDFEIFLFLLEECKANPNVGSRIPYGLHKVRQKNEGNMPLMVAAWEGKDRFVETLCQDERTSINQQDANGFTALMKACMNGNKKCREILIRAGADEKIVDMDGKTAEDWRREFEKNGALRTKFQKEGTGKKGKQNK